MSQASLGRTGLPVVSSSLNILVTLAEISDSLPNGFHDAVFHRCLIDYTARQIELRLSLWIGIMGADESTRERYAPVIVKVREFAYWVVQPPDNSRSPEQCESSIDGHEVSVVELHTVGLPATPDLCFAYSFYVNHWTSLIYVCAKDAALTYESAEDELYVRRLQDESPGGASIEVEPNS